MRALSGSNAPGRIARRVLATPVIMAVAAVPYTALGQCTPLTCDTAVSASIDAGGEVDCFTITAPVAVIVDVSVVSQEPGGTFQPAWRLLDAMGMPVAGDCGVFGGSAPNFPCGLPGAADGPYTLEVAAVQPGDTGAYAVRVAAVTAGRACEDVPLTCAEPAYGTTDDPLDTDLFSFDVLEDGGWVEISVVSGLHGGTVIDAAWRLVEGTGAPVDGPCGMFSESGIDYACGPLPASGNPYRVVVGDDDARDAGQYKVRVQPLSAGAACATTTLPCGVARTVTIGDPPPDQMCGFAACPVLDTELFSFSVADGERIAVTVENAAPAEAGFLAGWRLLDATGAPVEGTCGDFNATASRFACGPLAAAGNPYRIEVGDVGQFVAGTARVSVEFLDGTCASECAGDCDGNRGVAINELLTLVNIALGNLAAPACIAGDADRDGAVAISELITAVNSALDGCAGPPPVGAMFEPAPCAMSIPTGQDPADVRCGWLTVPENRARPEGRVIRLPVVILAATGPDPAPDPLVILSGGPGQWAIESVLPRFTRDFAAPLQAKRDLVIFDQRGSGRSQPALNCPEVSTYKDSLGVLTTTAEDLAIDTAIFRACHDRLAREGNDLSGYSSAATARDIDDLMTALGYDRFNLYGLSYGTRVALTALRDHTDARIRSVVLDSVVPPQADLVRTGSRVERSLDHLLADCAADPACNSAFPNLRQTTLDLVDRLNREPLMLMPVDPATQQPFPAIISGDRLVRLAESGFQSADLIPFIPTFITTTAAGNASLLTTALSLVAAPELYSPGLQNAVLCNEETPLIDATRAQQEQALVDPLIAHAYAVPDAIMQACPHFGLPAPDPMENEPVASDVPALIFAGDYDPNTPSAYGRLAAATLPNSVFFEFRGFGHVVLFQHVAPTGPPACAMQLMAAFLDDPQQAPDGSCVTAIPPPHFVGS